MQDLSAQGCVEPREWARHPGCKFSGKGEGLGQKAGNQCLWEEKRKAKKEHV